MAHLRCRHIMPLGFGLLQEAAVEIVDQIARAPVELRGDGGHVGGGEGGDHQAAQRGRKVGDHHADVAGLRVGEAGEENQRRQRDQHPRPRAHGVMRDVEPQRREQRILFVLRAEHALRDVAAAAGLGAGIPGGPPVHRNVDQERDHRHPRGVQVGDEVEHGALARPARRRSTRASLRLHAVDAADGAHREDRQHDHHAHLDDELKQVGDQHAPQSGERGDEGRERDHADDDERGLGVW